MFSFGKFSSFALSRFGFIIFLFLLTACGADPSPVPSPTTTLTGTPSPTATATLAPTETPTPTVTPEPAWYQSLDPQSGTLKYQYAEVTDPKARVYATFADAAAVNGNFGYVANYPAYVAYTDSRMTDDGRTFYQDQIYHGWIAAENLHPFTPSTFTGILLTREISFRFGWVLADTQSVNAAGARLRDFKRFDIIHEVESPSLRDGYVSIGADEWLPAASVTFTDSTFPAGADPHYCRFIHVDLQTNILRAYAGCKLVFATLVSTGKNSWTFQGRFTILNKWDYLTINSPDWSASDYYMEGIPYFMSYAGDFGFHGNYWNDDFGAAGSHGCINLSPTDAKWLYDWASLGEIVYIAGK